MTNSFLLLLTTLQKEWMDLPQFIIQENIGLFVLELCQGHALKYILPNEKDLKSKFYGTKSSVLDKKYKKYFFNMK